VLVVAAKKKYEIVMYKYSYSSLNANRVSKNEMHGQVGRVASRMFRKERQLLRPKNPAARTDCRFLEPASLPWGKLTESSPPCSRRCYPTYHLHLLPNHHQTMREPREEALRKNSCFCCWEKEAEAMARDFLSLKQ